jgi:hypothetical protein
MTARALLILAALLALAALMFFSPGDGVAPVFFGDGR